MCNITALSALREKVAALSDKERTVVLLLDEMQLRQTVEYDPSLKRMTGIMTLPNGLKKEATHALVTMIRCITIPWKQVISWHLTDNSISGDVLKIHVYDVIRAVESTNLQIMAIVSDMGPRKMDLWRSMGIKVSKTHVIHYTANPVQPEKRLYVLADPPHILKSIRNNLLKYVFNVNECTAFAAEAVNSTSRMLRMLL